MKTPIELAEKYVNKKWKDCDIPDDILEAPKNAEKEAYLAGYKAAQPKWISVEDELPDWQVRVAVLRKSGMPLIAYRQKIDYMGREVNDWNLKNITHWMALPPLKPTE